MKKHLSLLISGFYIALSISVFSSANTEHITTLPGFKVEKVHAVNKQTEGSWVGLTSDNKGRLIASDQYGGIYRLTLKDDSPPEVEKLNLKDYKAHGLLYAFNSLYVVSSETKTKGLYRLTNTNGDDQYDKEEYLVPFHSTGQ